MRISDWSSDVCSSDLTSVIRCIYDLPLKSYWTVIACEREAADAPNRMHQAREPEPNLRRPARPRIAADLRGRSRYGLLTPFRRQLGPAVRVRATRQAAGSTSRTAQQKGGPRQIRRAAWREKGGPD